MNTHVDNYLNNSDQWTDELTFLRKIVTDSTLSEDFKWRSPCYTYNNSNVILLSKFKGYCALSFFRGALLKDPAKILQLPGKHTQSGRLIKFACIEDITRLETVLRAYIKEAIAIHEAGLKVSFKKEPEPMPDELKQKLADDAAYRKAFEALTPGRQRGYILYFSAPKQSASKTARVEKAARRILAGKGLNDCICGHTKRPPGCDGSHKFIDQH